MSSVVDNSRPSTAEEDVKMAATGLPTPTSATLPTHTIPDTVLPLKRIHLQPIPPFKAKHVTPPVQQQSPAPQPVASRSSQDARFLRRPSFPSVLLRPTDDPAFAQEEHLPCRMPSPDGLGISMVSTSRARVTGASKSRKRRAEVDPTRSPPSTNGSSSPLPPAGKPLSPSSAFDSLATAASTALSTMTPPPTSSTAPSTQIPSVLQKAHSPVMVAFRLGDLVTPESQQRLQEIKEEQERIIAHRFGTKPTSQLPPGQTGSSNGRDNLVNALGRLRGNTIEQPPTGTTSRNAPSLPRANSAIWSQHRHLDGEEDDDMDSSASGLARRRGRAGGLKVQTGSSSVHGQSPWENGLKTAPARPAIHERNTHSGSITRLTTKDRDRERVEEGGPPAKLQRREHDNGPRTSTGAFPSVINQPSPSPRLRHPSSAHPHQQQHHHHASTSHGGAPQSASTPSHPQPPHTNGHSSGASTANGSGRFFPPSPPPGPPSPSSQSQAASKQAFLSLFSTFYDSLSDSRVLSSTLGNQISRASTLLNTLQDAGNVFDKMLAERLGGIERRTRLLEDDGEASDDRFARLERRIKELEERERLRDGIGGAIRLKERLGSRAEIIVVERDTDAGGVWKNALWPGGSVDVPIGWYQLYSDLNPNWATHYATRDDVFAYWQSLIERYGLRQNFRFETTFITSHWDAATHTHTVKLQGPAGKPYEVVVDFLISASGPLSTPTVPQIPGIKSFQGVAFHNFRWDTSVKLAGKRVAVIGNGSSGVQMAPGIAALPGTQLTHFIRSGAYFRQKVNYEYTALSRWSFKWVPGLSLAHRIQIFYQWYRNPYSDETTSVKHRKREEREALSYLKENAPPQYLDALLPDYPMGCKRVAMDAGWLASLHRPNVTLVNSKIVSADASGLITADGKHYDLDVIIFATGADVAHQGVGLNKGVYGKDGRELAAVWKDKGGPEAYRGLAVPEVPNYFTILGPNAVSGAWGYSSALAGAAIARIIDEVISNGGTSIVPTHQANDEFNGPLQKRLQRGPMGSDACSSWFKTEVGGKVITLTSHTPLKLWWLLRATRWSDWHVTSKKTGQNVNVGARIFLKRAFKALMVGLATGLVHQYWFTYGGEQEWPLVWEQGLRAFAT